MKNRILVNATPEETSMAVVIGGSLQEYVIERDNKEHIVGNIFKGRVKNLLKGIQAAFIDVGRDKNVFYYNGDSLPLSEGQSILIQVIKDAMGSKGPRAVTQISLAGRYVVFLPGASYIGVSRKIADADEKQRLKELAENLRPEAGGLIVRTVAEGCSREDIEKDVEYLLGLWQSIDARAAITEAPALLHREVDLPIRIVRDYLTANIDEIVIDDQDVSQRVKELISFSYPDYAGIVHYHNQKENIFKYYGFETEIENINSRHVSLECGGYLVFDYTEALTVIDVNTGSFKGAGNLEDTAFITNMQAVREIARQIRLRDIGGIIIIDFIDMGSEENRRQILESMDAFLSGDKMKPRVLGITNLGLVEMTRKKTRQNTAAALLAECPTCQGSGYVKSPEAISVEIRRKLRDISGGRAITVKAHPTVAEWFINHELPNLPRDRKVKVQAVEGMHPEIFSLYDGEQ